MSYRGDPNWPPAWTRPGGQNSKRPKGEIGILKDVLQPNILPMDRCFIIIDYDGDEYVGALLFDDKSFCRLVFKFLQAHCGESIRDIGGRDLSHTSWDSSFSRS
jgi:hypothetical protein